MNYLKFKVSRTLQTIIVTGIGKKYTRDAESKNLLRVYYKNQIFSPVSSSSMSFSSKIVDGGQLQWPIFEHVVFQEWKNKIIKASCWYSWV
jgi:hypothetical protein